MGETKRQVHPVGGHVPQGGQILMCYSVVVAILFEDPWLVPVFLEMVDVGVASAGQHQMDAKGFEGQWVVDVESGVAEEEGLTELFDEGFV